MIPSETIALTDNGKIEIEIVDNIKVARELSATLKKMSDSGFDIRFTAARNPATSVIRFDIDDTVDARSILNRSWDIQFTNALVQETPEREER